MRQQKIWTALTLMALGLTAFSAAANAGVSSTITLTNDYDFRGVSQSAKDPALQASLDYADDKSGWYVGAWGSNVDFGDSTDLELDLYTGFSGKTDAGLNWDAGIVYYTYDEHQYNYPEVYAGVGYKYLKGKFSYTYDYGGDSSAGHVQAINLALDASIPLPVNDLSITAHVGHSAIQGEFLDYTDWSAGIAYTLKKFNLALKYVDTDLPDTHSDIFNAGSRVVFTVSTTLPW